MSEPKYHNAWNECQTFAQLGIVHAQNEGSDGWWLVGPDGKRYGQRRDVPVSRLYAGDPAKTVSKVVGFNTWAEMAAIAKARYGVTSWQRTKRGAWLDAAAQLPKGIRHDGTGVPCETIVSNQFSSHRCLRLVVSETGLCRMHQSAAERRDGTSARARHSTRRASRRCSTTSGPPSEHHGSEARTSTGVPAGAPVARPR